MKTPKITALQAILAFVGQAARGSDRDLAMEYAELQAEFSKRLAKAMREVPADSHEVSESLAHAAHAGSGRSCGESRS